MSSIQNNKAIGRNERCFCGSGKKYKHCCFVSPIQNSSRVHISNDLSLPENQLEENLSLDDFELLERVHKNASHFLDKKKEAVVIKNNGEFEKMSEVLLEFASPLLEIANTLEEEKAAIQMAYLIWNTSFAPASEVEELLKEMMANIEKKTGARDTREVYKVFKAMFQRKKEHYSSCNRMIIDYQCSRRNGSLYLNVVSTLPQD